VIDGETDGVGPLRTGGRERESVGRTPNPDIANERFTPAGLFDENMSGYAVREKALKKFNDSLFLA
jgi:hypothetical protein